MTPEDILDVEGRASELLGYSNDLRGSDEQKYRAWINEATNEPRTSNPVDFRPGASHPDSSPTGIEGRKLRRGNQRKASRPPAFQPSFQRFRWNTPIPKQSGRALAQVAASSADHDYRLPVTWRRPVLQIIKGAAYRRRDEVWIGSEGGLRSHVNQPGALRRPNQSSKLFN